MALPHPKSGEDKEGKENKPDRGGVIRNLVKRTVNVAKDRNAEDDVNPTED